MKSMLVAARTRGFVYTDEGRQKWGYVGNATDEVVTFHIPEVDAAVANATAARSKRRHRVCADVGSDEAKPRRLAEVQR